MRRTLVRGVVGLVGYGLGSFMVAPRLARRHGVDLYATSDGNPGAWNALEQLGVGSAWIAFAGDGAKAAVAGTVGIRLDGWGTGAVGVGGAIVGHVLPLPRPARGGKGVMCLVGGMLVLAPEAWLRALSVCIGVSARVDFRTGVRSGFIALPLLQAASQDIERVEVTGVLMSLVGCAFLIRRPARPSPHREGGSAPKLSSHSDDPASSASASAPRA